MWRAVTWRGRAAMGAAAGAAAFALPTANAKPLPSPTGQSSTSARRREEEYLMPLQKKLGVLRLEGWGNPQSTGTGVEGYVPLAGDIDDRDSYDFAFIGEVAEGCTFAALCDPARFDDPEQMQVLLSGVQNAIKRLVVRGAQAIIGNCGLFMWLHATGLIEQAVDKAMDDLGPAYTRPPVMLSSLTTLAYDTGLASCATFGVGEGQEKALARWKRWLFGEVTARKCKVVVFTSNGDSCKVMLKALPQLQGLKVFTSDEEEGDVLVVGLNGVVNGEKVPVIGLKGVSENPYGQVGGESVNGFNAVATGKPMFFDIVQPDIRLVAKAVKERYPTVRMVCVECTEVSAYSDTIRQAMRVPVHDPINTAYGMLHALQPTNIDHTSEDTQLPKPLLGVLRLQGFGNPETTQTGVKGPEHATEVHPYTGYLPHPGGSEFKVTRSGDIDAEDSYMQTFDFIGEVAEGCTFEALCDPARLEQIEELLPGVQTAIKKLVERGAQAILGNCGLFMWLHATGLIEQAVDNVMDELGADYDRPHVMLSSLTTLGSSLATLGVGEGQEKALARWNLPRTSRWKRWLFGEVTARKCKVVVFTSNGDSCKVLLNALPQLQGLKVFTSDEETEGDVLVVGLNGVVNGEKVPVIGLEGVSVNGQVGGGNANGFDAVATGQPVLYDIVQPDIMRVAKAVKEKYPTVGMAYVECTEVSAYSDTIKYAMRVPVHDPINGACGMMNAANNHNFRQLGNKERIAQLASALDMTPAELVTLGILDAQLLEVGASDAPLHDEGQWARAMQLRNIESRQRVQIALMLSMPMAPFVKNGILDAQLPEVGASDDPLHDLRQRARAM